MAGKGRFESPRRAWQDAGTREDGKGAVPRETTREEAGMTHTREEAVTRVVIEHGDGFQEEIDVARLAARADVDPLPVARARAARIVIHLLERIARPMQDETYAWKEIADGAEHLALHAYELHHEALSATSLAARAEHLILCDTRQRLARPERWTRRGYARDSQGEVCSLSSEQATCWCVTGALTLASIRTRPLIDGLDRDTSEAALHNAEDRVARAIGGGSVPNWQDAETTTHEQVLKALDVAIASQCRCGNMHTDPTCVVHPPPPVRERENERQAVAVLARELEPAAGRRRRGQAAGTLSDDHRPAAEARHRGARAAVLRHDAEASRSDRPWLQPAGDRAGARHAVAECVPRGLAPLRDGLQARVAGVGREEGA